MSRIAKDPVKLSDSVKVIKESKLLKFEGPKGLLTLQIHPSVSVEVVDKQIVVKWSSDEARAMAGTMRALISNCVIGVTQGYMKNIKLNGVGYRAKVEGKKITLTLGFSHPVIYELPPEVDAKSEGQTEFNLTSINKQILGQVSSEIRAFRPPEPYKGKGVFVDNEHVIRKERKKAATA